MTKDFKNNLIEKIKKEKIKPISKKYFIARKILINFFLIFSVFIWAISVAIIFWYLYEADWFLSHKLWLIKITTIFLPFFWLIFLIFSSILAYFNFKNKENWYKFYCWQIVLWNILASFIIWLVFYFSGFSQIVEEKIQNNIFKYREVFVPNKISRMKKIWQNEEKGLLLWIIIKSTEGFNPLLLKDTNNKIWKIKISEKTTIRHNLKLKSWIKIKLIWKKVEKNLFKVNEIRPFMWNWKWFNKNHKAE